MNVPGPVVSAFPKRARWWTTHDLYYDNNGRKKQQRNIGIIGSKKIPRNTKMASTKSTGWSPIG